MREPQESLSTLVSRVVDDAKHVARAEVDLVKAKVFGQIAGYRSAVVLFLVAGVVALLALIGLVIGAIFSLATVIGPGLATLAVVGTLLVIAAILGWVGARRVKTA